MKKHLTMLFLAMALLPLSAVFAAEVSAEEFMARARRRNTEATYAKLHGHLQHRRRGKPVLTMPVYFATIIHPDRMFGQLVLNGNEGYTLIQASGSGETTVKNADF